MKGSVKVAYHNLSMTMFSDGSQARKTGNEKKLVMVIVNRDGKTNLLVSW